MSLPQTQVCGCLSLFQNPIRCYNRVGNRAESRFPWLLKRLRTVKRNGAVGLAFHASKASARVRIAFKGGSGQPITQFSLAIRLSDSLISRALTFREQIVPFSVLIAVRGCSLDEVSTLGSSNAPYPKGGRRWLRRGRSL